MSPNLKTTRNPPNTILAIDPSTRDLGVAVFAAGHLAYYAVKSVRPQRPRRALLQSIAYIIEHLINEFEPSVLAIERIALLQRSEAMVSVVTDEIRMMAIDFGLVIYEYDLALVRRLICQSPDATKQLTMLALCNHYPELSQYVDGQSKGRMRHYGHLFDAVAVGLVCARETVDLEQPVIHIQQQVLF
ncbi:MAG TPA: crossover junction endodeoxyribonuclease RuvC [Blastocatellia bacterium]|nr:crossover junction endodeoxyribonuclease RuvC [Blastocatellia bacterium]